MSLPSKLEAENLLHRHVTDTYQRLHADMVGRAVEGYASTYKADPHLWWLTGFLHDIDYQEYPSEHPGPSLEWFKEWEYPEELIHAVEAHALGFNEFTTKPETDLAKVLLACDEVCGIFYAYQKLNPIPYKDMKVSSVKKKLLDERFAPGISRPHITSAVAELGITIDAHIENLISSLSALDSK